MYLTEEATMTSIARQPPRPPREFVDFSSVPPHQYEIHERLEDWRRWCRMRPNAVATPMFRLHKSDEWERPTYGATTTTSIDRDAALRIAKLVPRLPEKHRMAIQWFYIQNGRNPRAKAQELAQSLRGLADLVIDARQMILNLGG